MLRQPVVSNSAKGYHSVEQLRGGRGWKGPATPRAQVEPGVRLRTSVTRWETTGPDWRVGKEKAWEKRGNSESFWSFF